MKNERLLSILLGLALLAATLVAYGPAIDEGGFIWDDDSYVQNNPLLQGKDGLRKIWNVPHLSPQYYPLVFTTFRIEQALVGLEPWLYHLTQVLLHAGVSILLWRLLLFLKVPGAFIAALLFAVHPVHAESVAWITERKNTLSALFYFLSLHAYVRFHDFETERRADARWHLMVTAPLALLLVIFLIALGIEGRDFEFEPTWLFLAQLVALGIAFKRPWYALSLLCFALALYSKTVTSTLAPVILLLAWWKTGKLGRDDLLRSAPFFAMGLIGGFVTILTELTHVEAVGPEWDLGLGERTIIAGRAIAFYAQKIVWPDPIIFIYPRWEIDAASLQWLFPIGVLGLMALLVALAMKGRISRGPATALFFFAGSLFPALGFVNTYPMRYSFVADHFQYIASIGLLVPIAALIARVRPKPALVVVALALAVALGLKTRVECGKYEGLKPLWEDTTAKNPEAWMAWNNLGSHYFRRREYEKAETYFRKAHELGGHAREVINNIGLYESAKGNLEGSVDLFEEALERDPAYVAAMANAAISLSGLGRHDEAMVYIDRLFEVVAQRRRTYNYGYWARAQVLHGLGRHREALPDMNRFLGRKKSNPLAWSLRAEIHLALGNDRAAQRDIERSLAIKKNFSPPLVTLGRLQLKRGDHKAAAESFARAMATCNKENFTGIAELFMRPAFKSIVELPPARGAALAIRLSQLASPRGVPVLDAILKNLARTRRRAHLKEVDVQTRDAPEGIRATVDRYLQP